MLAPQALAPYPALVLGMPGQRAGVGGRRGNFNRTGATAQRRPGAAVDCFAGQCSSTTNKGSHHGRSETRCSGTAIITVHGQSRVLEVGFADGSLFRIPFELMRVYSPSAEVQGHGPGQEVLQTGKRLVELDSLDPVGNYAVQPRFSDGHDTGIFSWDYLYFLGSQQDQLWAQYQARLAAAGVDRDADMPAPASHGCASH